MNKKLERYLNSKTGIVLFIVMVAFWWLYNAHLHSSNLNENSVVTTGIVTRVSNHRAHYKFLNKGQTINSSTEIYSGFNYYTGKLNEHLEPGDKVIVRFNPERIRYHRLLKPAEYSINLDSLNYGQTLELKLPRVTLWEFN